MLSGMGLGRMGVTRRERAWSPIALFGNGETGFLFGNFLDLSKLFTTSGGATNVAADTDPVGQANDQSGKGNNVTQATTTKRPLWRSNSGKPYLSLDGTDDMLGSSFNPTNALTMAMAVRVTANVADQYVMGGGETATVARGYLGVQGTTNLARAVWGSTTLLGAADITGGDHVLLVTGNASTVSLWVDAVKVATATPAGAPGGTTGPIAIGGINANGTPSGWFAGRGYAALAVNRRVTDLEVGNISRVFRGAYQ